VKIWPFFVGIVVFLSMILVITPPSVRCRGTAGNIEKKHVLHFACKDTCLDRRTECDYLIGIDALWALCRKNLSLLPVPRYPCGASDKHNLVYLTGCQLCIFKSPFAWLDGSLDQDVGEFFEF
jgi:hypothetical protein